jgi:hypothetical protein
LLLQRQLFFLNFSDLFFGIGRVPIEAIEQDSLKQVQENPVSDEYPTEQKDDAKEANR